MTAFELLESAKKAGSLRTVFRFPYVNLICASPSFEALEEEEREEWFARQVGVGVAELRSTVRNNLFSLRLVTPEEANRDFPESAEETRGNHWLQAFVEREVSSNGHRPPTPAGQSIIHFYGYKGGQARSTLAGILAKTLAADGWRVLVVDGDLEAPSLSILFNRSPETLSGSLLGVVQGSTEITPERILPSTGTGYVDFLACRPESERFDIDVAALALRSALDPSTVENAAEQLLRFSQHKYDVVLLDHRAGLSPSTLSWINRMPGPVVVCVRLDDQWRPARQVLKSILGTYPPNPGVFVSWKPDDEAPETYTVRNYTQITSLLNVLAESLTEASEDTGVEDIQGELSFVEVSDHWLLWPYDIAFRSAHLPDTQQLSAATLKAIADLRSLLDISGIRPPRTHTSVRVPLSPSGAMDPGDLIQTEALRQLRTAGNSISYILGRKGTGKTRLLRELATLGVGEALVVDPYYQEPRGLKSASPELERAAAIFKENAIDFWWHLLSAAVETGTTDTASLIKSFSREMNRPTPSIAQIVEKVSRSPKRVFLLDGLETAFTAKTIFQFIESLFRFLQIVETDSRLSDRIRFKLFLRTDLAQRGYQNIEQQLHGRAIYLSWDTQKIFNFVLSRMIRNDWYGQNFPVLIEAIQAEYDRILQGELSVEECETLLMLAFPSRLRRNNLATRTFLKTYFADTASDKPEMSTSDRLRYYPRIFDRFLEVIANPKSTDIASSTEPQLDRDHRISQGLIFIAHEAAAADYLEQLRSELIYLISFSDDQAVNSDKVREVLSAFDGLKTPFNVDDHVEAISVRTALDPAAVRTAMYRMKSIGLFEDRPGYPNEWRVGRLFKSSLRMKYVRGGPGTARP